MRRISVVLLLAAAGLVAGENWKTGFWFWYGSAKDETWPKAPVDSLYVLLQYNGWPAELPAAREYWAVFRQESTNLPTSELLLYEARQAAADARKRGLALAGIQLDVDCPTGRLREYAQMLRNLKSGLGPNLQLSITALLDWFRDGTDVAKVIQEVDEFVPQFYDVAAGSAFGRGGTIAARIDAAKWGTVFNRFGKRFRIGISTFGRARLVSNNSRSNFYSDVRPIELAREPAFQLEAKRNDAQELVLMYRAVRSTQFSYSNLQAGDAMEFVLPTPEMVRAGVEGSRKMGGLAAGVVFFRWPDGRSGLTLPPEEVLSPGVRREARARAMDGRCAAVSCADLYFESGAPLAPTTLRYRLRSSEPLEYFLPEKKMPVRMTGPAELELTLPAYCARGRLYLGRVVSQKRVEFTVEERP